MIISQAYKNLQSIQLCWSKGKKSVSRIAKILSEKKFKLTYIRTAKMQP